MNFQQERYQAYVDRRRAYSFVPLDFNGWDDHWMKTDTAYWPLHFR